MPHLQRDDLLDRPISTLQKLANLSPTTSAYKTCLSADIIVNALLMRWPGGIPDFYLGSSPISPLVRLPDSSPSKISSPAKYAQKRTNERKPTRAMKPKESITKAVTVAKKKKNVRCREPAVAGQSFRFVEPIVADVQSAMDVPAPWPTKKDCVLQMLEERQVSSAKPLPVEPVRLKPRPLLQRPLSPRPLEPVPILEMRHDADKRMKTEKEVRPRYPPAVSKTIEEELEDDFMVWRKEWTRSYDVEQKRLKQMAKHAIEASKLAHREDEAMQVDPPACVRPADEMSVAELKAVYKRAMTGARAPYLSWFAGSRLVYGGEDDSA